jgi:hypothetical protein
MYGGSPLDTRYSGVHFDQPDMPWWAVAVLGWLGIVKAIQEGYGEVGEGYRKALDLLLEQGNPQKVYRLYEDYVTAMKAEAARK